MDEEKKKIEKLNGRIRLTHEFYICFILISIIIVLCSYNFSENANLTNYLSFALTVSSLLLALVAIGITLIGNVAIERQFDRISETNIEVKKSSSDIEEASLQLNKQIETLSTYIKDIGDKIENNSERIKEITEKSLFNFSPANSDDKSENETRKLDISWNNISLSGIIIIYAVKIHFEKNIPFNLEEFSMRTKRNNSENLPYNHGFFIACVFSGIIETKKYDTYEFKIEKLNIDTNIDFEEKFNEKIEIFKDMGESKKDKIRIYFKKIEKYLKNIEKDFDEENED